jgi:hypothetical protein
MNLGAAYSGNVPLAVIVGAAGLVDAAIAATGAKAAYDSPWAIYSPFAGMHRIDNAPSTLCAD